jgi:hypothetical protein
MYLIEPNLHVMFLLMHFLTYYDTLISKYFQVYNSF